MHIMFRQYAQQMGMQNVRAILPEQIDIVLNDAQMEMVNRVIKQNIGTTNDRATDNSKLAQINALRTLYKVKNIDLLTSISSIDEKHTDDKGMFLPIIPITGEKYYTKEFVLQYTTSDNHPHIKTGANLPSYLYMVDFSINYVKTNNGLEISHNKETNEYNYIVPTTSNLVLKTTFVTQFFPVRLIDDVLLADTTNDFILKNRLRSPIIVSHDNGFDLYIDKAVIDTNNKVTLEHSLVPYILRMTYIAKPTSIKFISNQVDNEGMCQLPEYMHEDIVKRAVNLYRIAVSGSLYGIQQVPQQNTINNYSNEGN
uniref:Capsid protein n=1 Tax=Geladintestivirus 2 TaxID=3233134 RepID=A0AAU8MKW4_9CAUD